MLPALDAVDLAAVRGTAMSAACALTPTGMSAVMGGDTDAVLAALAELDLVGANVNGGGQIVAAGPLDALAQLAANPPSGIRVIPLPVAGAFHTSFMGSAESAFQAAPGRDHRRRSRPPVADQLRRHRSSPPGRPTSGCSSPRSPGRSGGICACKPCARSGVTGVLELPPAGTLVGLVKRDLKGVATMALKSPADLDNAAAFAAEHAGVRA